MNHKPRRIGEVLMDKGMITRDQLDIALIEQRTRHERLGRTLVQLGFITENMLCEALGEALQQESIDLGTALPDPEAIALVPLETARRHNVLPVSFRAETARLLLATADTFNIAAADRIAALHGGSIGIDLVLAGDEEIRNAIDRFYGYELSIDGILKEIETGEVDHLSLEAEDAEYSHPMIRLVHRLIADAVKRGASDIHFEPERRYLRIRYRIDGVLRQVRSLHARYWSTIAVRIKVMAGINIAETRAAQDGRIQWTLYGHTVDFRVSTLPTLHGENIVLRILDRQEGIIPLERLGFRQEDLATLRLMMARPEGIILVTGPTGSGKTTTLYSILDALNTDAVNIMTLEDPVEYPVSGIRQSSIDDSNRLTFAGGIRSMLRQDPDVILVGEIRDAETAEMALRAAMTGHQVYSTLHANSAVGAVPRLLHIGLPADMLAGNVIGIVAQRLVRCLCPHCRQPYEADANERRTLGAQQKSVTLWRAGGCADCDHQGYKGRRALVELLRIQEGLEEIISRRGTLHELRAAARGSGYHDLANDGIRRALEGMTSLDEVARVVDLTGRGAGL